ncbi:metal-dependent transcriptional regulator [Kineosporia babensis]|uniref:Metal-dependent transcriptional regulator n=1 Tax=Kineosporia babensis TaxID=499548 RepID=A0A9X1NGV2_9ACTN|nr:metal-dependent transcriptional regulator [Kineosporia babensis]MCD5314797.1 metal-dependent transcriptional regulator [Kineosporia babensis]
MNDHDLVDTSEMYLKAVLELEEEGVVALRARLVERFGHSGPTVSQTVDRLRRDGLLDLGADRQILLTEAGRTMAGDVMRKHRLTEVFLHQVVGLEWPLLHTEACRWEHVISDHTEGLIAVLLKNPVTSPYGNPIAAGQVSAAENLTRRAVDAGTPVSISWIGEPLQADPDALEELEKQGIIPGAVVTVTEQNSSSVVLVKDAGGEVRLPAQVAKHLFVAVLSPELPRARRPEAMISG